MQQLADWNLFWEKDEAIINHQLFAKVKKNLLTSRVKDILQKQTSSCPLILFLYYSAHIQAFAPSSDLLSFRRQKWPNKAFIIDSTQTKSGEGNQKSDDYVPWNSSIIGSSKIADLNFKTPSKLFLANGTADEKVKSLLVIWNEKDPYIHLYNFVCAGFYFYNPAILFLKMSWVVWVRVLKGNTGQTKIQLFKWVVVCKTKGFFHSLNFRIHIQLSSCWWVDYFSQLCNTGVKDTVVEKTWVSFSCTEFTRN